MTTWEWPPSPRTPEYAAVGTPPSSVTTPVQQPYSSGPPPLRAQRHRVLLPAHQVRGADVAPGDPVVPGGLRVVLEEDVVAAVDVADAVGVVDPALGGARVEAREGGVGVGGGDVVEADGGEVRGWAWRRPFGG